MKTCPYCSAEQPEENFEIAVVVKDKTYRRLKCRKCKNETQTIRTTKLKKWFVDYKKTLRCERCGFDDYRALEFHHRDATAKDFNVADMVQKGFSVESIRREISTCQIMCANCHRLEHYR